MTNTGDRLSQMVGPLGLVQGWPDTQYPQSPAAGADFTLAVPGEKWQRFTAINCRLSTSAVVANRTMQFRILDADGVLLWSQVVSGAIVASSVFQIYLAPNMGTPALGIAGVNVASMPDLILPSGYQVQFHVLAMDAGDQIDHVQLVLQDFATSVIRASVE